jgi:hypothetical protein
MEVIMETKQYKLTVNYVGTINRKKIVPVLNKARRNKAYGGVEVKRSSFVTSESSGKRGPG